MENDRTSIPLTHGMQHTDRQRSPGRWSLTFIEVIPSDTVKYGVDKVNWIPQDRQTRDSSPLFLPPYPDSYSPDLLQEARGGGLSSRG